MELRWLTAFVAVAEELSYRRAAERLLVAQPAISQQIMNLEKDLGARPSIGTTGRRGSPTRARPSFHRAEPPSTPSTRQVCWPATPAMAR